MFEEIVSVLKKADNIIVFTHVNPDGDALGSCVGFKKAMESLGKKVTVCLERPLPGIFECFGDNFVTREEIAGDYELAVSLDCGAKDRLGELEGLFKGNTLNIDHHYSNTLFGNVNYVDGDAAATGEIVYKLVKYMDIDISPEIASALYGAILTDTGGFMFANTTTETHLIAAELISSGADFYNLNKKLMQEKEYKRHLITAKCIENMEFYTDGKICVSVFTNEYASELGMSGEDTNGLSSVPRSVKGVEVGILITEIKKGVVKVSLRSDELVDVSQIAAKFGGGGHKRASGITLPDADIFRVKEDLISEFEKLF